MGLAEFLGCEGCKRRKAKLKILITKAREKWKGVSRPRSGKQK